MHFREFDLSRIHSKAGNISDTALRELRQRREQRKRGQPHRRWHPGPYTEKCRFMEKRLREISRFFVALRRESAPAVCARPHTPFSINTSTSVHSMR